jgi:hypothetical protein
MTSYTPYTQHIFACVGEAEEPLQDMKTGYPMKSKLLSLVCLVQPKLGRAFLVMHCPRSSSCGANERCRAVIHSCHTQQEPGIFSLGMGPSGNPRHDPLLQLRARHCIVVLAGH